MTFAHIAAGIVAMTSAAQSNVMTFHADGILGTSLDIAVVATEPADARAAAIAIGAEIDRLDRLLSAWRPDSELSRLNEAASSAVSPEMFAVIKAAAEWRTRSDGAFDERLGGIASVWRDEVFIDAALTDPSIVGDRLATARMDVGLDSTEMRVTKPASMQFSLDGIAKGYIIDAAVAAAMQAAPGLRGLMLDIGGDIRCWGRSPDRSGWNIGVADACVADNLAPREVVRLNNKSIATSGIGARYTEYAGRRYSHLISASTGSPVEMVRSATAVADTAMDADALATSLALMSPDAGATLVRSIGGAEASVLLADGRRWSSSGWSDMVIAQSQMPSLRQRLQSNQSRIGGWPLGFELRVQFEIPKVTQGPVRRPYVAIWVSDSSGRAIRSLMLLGTRAYYQNSNYRWWRLQSNPRVVMDSVARPTRAPGRYTVVWDGTDDAGNAVAPGTYNLHIEASRQFGGHSFISSELNVGSKPFKIALPAAEEIGRTSIEFGRAE